MKTTAAAKSERSTKTNSRRRVVREPALDFQLVLEARERIRQSVRYTPAPMLEALSRKTGVRLFGKREYLQRTGSFKERGACHALMALSSEQRQRGVVAASAGNHALGLAWHGGNLGVPVTVVMPENAPRVKVDNCRRLGARVVLEGESFAVASQAAGRLAVEEGLHAVHPFDDPVVMAGQGTIGLELVEQIPDLEAVVVPVGGGGLLAGLSVAVRSVLPHVEIIGVEPEAAASYSAAWQNGGPRRVPVGATLADGLAVAEVGSRGFGVSRDRVDRVVTVSEDEIAGALLQLFETERIVVEGAGATGLAAVLAGKCPELAGRRTALLLCGGNIDADSFARALQRGLAFSGRSGAQL